MCMNCGCGNINEQHKEIDLTMANLKAMAEAHGISVSEVIKNLRDALNKAESEA